MADRITIKTDRKWRSFKYRGEVPAGILTGQFDWLDAEEADGFIQYRGCWYHLSEFMRVDGMPSLDGWHGYKNDSFFSGVVIKLSPDGEEYRIGTYLS